MNIVHIILFIPFLAINSSSADQCELSAKYKDVWLTHESYTIEKTVQKVDFDTSCSILAFKNSHFGYKHSKNTSECHLITINRRNLTYSRDKDELNRVTVDAEFQSGTDHSSNSF